MTDEKRWQDDAACLNYDQAIFFPTITQSAERAKTICNRCPVAGECLDYAITNDETEGVWGGLSEGQRKKLAGKART